MQTVTTNGIALHLRLDGPEDGRVVMLANSLGTDLRIWDPLLPHLPPGLRIVRFDKRGHGLSDEPPGPYTIDDLVADAAAICDSLDLRDVTFVGLSIGGLIGQGLAAQRPDLLRALVLMDTAAQIGTAEMWNARIAALRAGGIAALVDPILERWFTEDFRANDPSFVLWRNMLLRSPLEGYLGCCAAIAGADLTAGTRALRLPVMALVGDQDGSTPPEIVRATAALVGAACHVIDGAGHIPCVERPEQTARLICDFLERTA